MSQITTLDNSMLHAQRTKFYEKFYERKIRFKFVSLTYLPKLINFEDIIILLMWFGYLKLN